MITLRSDIKSPFYEQIYEQIQKLITDWFAVEQEIAVKQNTLDLETGNLENLKAQLQMLARISSVLSSRTEEVQKRKA